MTYAIPYSMKGQKTPAAAATPELVGAGEAFKTGLDFASNTETIYSRWLNKDMENSQFQQVQDAARNGQIPKNVLDFYGNDTNGIAHYMNRHRGADMITKEDIAQQKKNILETHSKQYAEAMENTGVWGKVAAVGGMMTGMVFDLDLVVGAGIYKALAVPLKSASVLRKGWTATKIATSLEAGKQASVYQFQNSVGMERSIGEAVTNVLFAGLGEGAAVTAIEGLAKVMSPTRKVVKALDNIEKSYGSNIPTDVSTSIATLKRSLDSGLSEDAVEILETLQTKMDAYESAPLSSPVKDVDSPSLVVKPRSTKKASRAERRAKRKARKAGKLKEQQTKPPEGGVTTHPADELDLLEPEDIKWLKDNDRMDIFEEVRGDYSHIEELTECLIGNGVKIP